VIRVERKKTVDGGIDLAAQSMLHSLAHHGPLLAGNRQEIGVHIRQKLLAKRHVKILARPGRTLRRSGAHLEVVDSQFPSKVYCRIDQLALRFGIGRRRTTVNRKRKGHQGVPEQAAANFGQRQNAYDFAPSLGDAIMGAMLKNAFDDLLPPRAVKKARPSTSLHERVPTLLVRAFEGANND